MEKTLAIFILVCAQLNEGFLSNPLHMKAVVSGIQTDATPDDTCLGRTDAEKILGLPAHQIESSAATNDDIVKYQCTWEATKEEVKSNLYYISESYATNDLAHQVFADILSANHNPGQSRPDGIGDEAWFHSDGSNFCLIIVRKGNKMLRIKVNKLTKDTSIEELKRVAREWK
jgi:hypothetical protein